MIQRLKLPYRANCTLIGTMTDAPPTPTPLHLLRSHSSAISALSWSTDNERIYSADSSGRVVITNTRTLRALASWNPHTDSVLGVEEWNTSIITHGRDNKLHVWQRIEELPAETRIGASAALPNLPTPALCYSMDVNALNFCRFSLFPRGSHQGEAEHGGTLALLALPNLIDSSTTDVWTLPGRKRLHAAIGQRVPLEAATSGARNSSGIIMSLHLYQSSNAALRLLTAYENGSVVLREYTRGLVPSVEGVGWSTLWSARIHKESVMSMRVTPANDFALTVSADHIIGRYDLADNALQREAIFRTKHAGNGCVALRDDGRICAIGGWDGKVRLYSTKTFKHLGTLKYHKAACQCIEFTHARNGAGSANVGRLSEDDEDNEPMSMLEKEERDRWLVTGARDNRVAIWPLLSFSK